MKISVKVKEDIRDVLKKGSEYIFDFDSENYNKEPYIFISGNNGSGKSTLINCIRCRQCDNDSEKKSGEAMTKLGYMYISELKEKSEIETDFEKIFFFSSEFDDPFSFRNAYDACGFVSNGGFAVQNKSNGEKILLTFVNWLERNKKEFDDKTLIVLDEADRGYDLRYQKGFMNLLQKFSSEQNVKFLIVEHNLLPILLAKNKIFCMDYNIAVSGEFYVLEKTGMFVKLKDLNDIKDNGKD